MGLALVAVFPPWLVVNVPEAIHRPCWGQELLQPAPELLLLPLRQYKSHLARVLFHLPACEAPQLCPGEQHALCLYVVTARSASGGFARGLSREGFPLLFQQTTPATAGGSKPELRGRTTTAELS